MCYRTGKYTVCRRVRASFSPEILQAGEVKGLMQIFVCDRFGAVAPLTWSDWCFAATLTGTILKRLTCPT